MIENLRKDAGVEALRGIAACMVVATHYAHWLTANTGAWAFLSTGVNLFFVLSGFVFAPYFLGRPIAPLPHAVRRFFRMYPLYVFALLSYALLKVPSSTQWTYLPEHLLMAHTLQSQTIAFYYNPAFWSLPPEVEFYAMLPMLALMSRKLGLVAVVGLGASLHFAVAFIEPIGFFSQEVKAIASVHFPGVLIEFLLGVIGFKVIARLSQSDLVRAAFCLGITGLVLLVLSATVFACYVAGELGQVASPPQWVATNMGLFAATAYAFIVAAVSVLSRLATLPMALFFSWGGRLSYGIYLFHNAAQQCVARFFPTLEGMLGALTSFVLTVCVATILHILVEAPCRTIGRKLSSKIFLDRNH